LYKYITLSFQIKLTIAKTLFGLSDDEANGLIPATPKTV